MGMSPKRAKAIRHVDEQWTKLVDGVLADRELATKKLLVLTKWKNLGHMPKRMSVVAAREIVELAWLAMAEAALRSVEERNTQ